MTAVLDTILAVSILFVLSLLVWESTKIVDEKVKNRRK